MRLDDLRRLPKFRDVLSFLYLEHGRVEQEDKSIAYWDSQGKHPIPAAALGVLLLGPGVAVTHAALLQLADNNTLVLWVGEAAVRYYCHGLGGTRSAAALLRQAELCSNMDSRLRVARRMYRLRFGEDLPDALSMEQLRGMEAVRIRRAYRTESELTGVHWAGRTYDRGEWGGADGVNRALSAANSCLYAVCHAAILSLGLSPGLGFIHTGKQLSFVYDVADFYKTTLTIPLAFELAQSTDEGIERTVRLACRDRFYRNRLLRQIVRDVQTVLESHDLIEAVYAVDEDPALPAPLWAPTEEGFIDRDDA